MAGRRGNGGGDRRPCAHPGGPASAASAGQYPPRAGQRPGASLPAHRLGPGRCAHSGGLCRGCGQCCRHGLRSAAGGLPWSALAHGGDHRRSGAAAGAGARGRARPTGAVCPGLWALRCDLGMAGAAAALASTQGREWACHGFSQWPGLSLGHCRGAGAAAVGLAAGDCRLARPGLCCQPAGAGVAPPGAGPARQAAGFTDGLRDRRAAGLRRLGGSTRIVAAIPVVSPGQLEWDWAGPLAPAGHFAISLRGCHGGLGRRVFGPGQAQAGRL